MESYRRHNMLILPSLLFILSELSSSSDQRPEEISAVTIPRGAETVSAWVPVETTECSVTCGVGTKTEKRCLVDQSGIHKDCAVVMVECLANRMCGLVDITLGVGDPLTIDCHIPPAGTIGGQYRYYWKKAAGIITINDIYFQYIKDKNSSIVFESIQVKDAGTYRCEVQRDNDLKSVKCIYYGVRVINPGILDINYNKYVIGKKKLASMAEEASAEDTRQVVEETPALNGEIYTYVGIGTSVGLLTGIIVIVLFRCASRSKKEESDNSVIEF